VAPNGSKNIVHPNFMKMEFCFRCHDLEGKVKMTGQKAAPGVCTSCHPAGFELIPETHKAADWAGAVHGEKSKEIIKEMGALEVEAKVLEEEGIAPYLAAPVDPCFTCHVESKFCQPCHDKLKVSTTP
jgi:cytochrome c5